MQTFLPYKDFEECARVLDTKRLGKQRVENLQILKALTLPKYGWQNHPAVRMWRGYEWSLLIYHQAIVCEWRLRGFEDTTWEKFLKVANGRHLGTSLPVWYGDERVHKTHRSNLLQKDPKHYGQFGWTEPTNLCYFWPV